MNPNRKIQYVQFLIRKIGFLPLVEKFRTFLAIIKYYYKNNEFIKENQGFRIPPQALAYDAYSAPDWSFYKKSGEVTAIFLSAISKKYLKEVSFLKILEWGCGPGRVIRHIPSAYPFTTKIYGTDYNKATIEWCNENIINVDFVLNNLKPPLVFEHNTFDFVYSISVFTHLSEENCHSWISELYRVVRPGGLMVVSLNGDSRKKFMLNHELEKYIKNGVLIRDNFEEGKKMYFACHSPNYLKQKLFKNFEVLEFIPEGFPHTGQDCWILRKPS